MVMGLLSPRGSQITTTVVAGTGLCDDLDARAMLACFGVLLLLLRSRDRFRVRRLGLARWVSFFFFVPFHS